MRSVVGPHILHPHLVVLGFLLSFSDTPEVGPYSNIDNVGSTAILPVASASSSPSSGSSGSLNVGALAGGVVCGVIAISVAAFIIFLIRRRKHRQSSPTAAGLDPVPQPVMDDLRPQSSAGAAFVPSSSPDMRSTPSMKLYVRLCRRHLHDSHLFASFLYA
jgi:hypothetical protein